jgi:membrane protein YdbS with pleckstrin-like domain
MSHLLFLLAAGQYVYEPFKKPLPVWNYWYLLALPLCLGIAIVYKSVRCDPMKRVPREAAVLFVTIIAALVLIAAGLAMLVNFLS